MNGRAKSAFAFPCFCAFAALTAAAICGCREGVPGGATSQPSNKYDSQYADALATADHFCQLWTLQDYAAARLLMSKRLIGKHPEAEIKAAFAGGANPRHAAFEIYDGVKLPDGRYSFKLRRFFRFAGEQNDRIESPLDAIAVAKDPNGPWRVDEFPIP